MILEIEFGIYEGRPVAETHSGLTFHVLTSSKQELLKYMNRSDRYASETQLYVAGILSSVSSEDAIRTIYKQIDIFPKRYIDKLYMIAVNLGFIPHLSEAFSAFLDNILYFESFKYYNKPDKVSRFLASVLKALDNMRDKNILDRLERSLGILWTREDVAGFSDGGVSEGKRENVKQVRLPLALTLMDNSKEFIKGLKSQLRSDLSEEEFNALISERETVLEPNKQETNVSTDEKPDKINKEPNKSKPSEPLIRKHGTTATSIRYIDKELFKETFFKQDFTGHILR